MNGGQLELEVDMTVMRTVHIQYSPRLPGVGQPSRIGPMLPLAVEAMAAGASEEPQAQVRVEAFLFKRSVEPDIE